MAFSSKPKSSASGCLCHKPGIQGQLTKFTDVSWETFKEAANLRHDQIADNMTGKWEDGPFGFYHRTCYQTYSAKNLLERVEKRRKIEEQSLPNEANPSVMNKDEKPNPCIRRSSIPTTDLKKCSICQDEKPDSKNRRKKEKLTLCETMEAGTTLLDAANIQGNQRLVLALTDKDPVAIELCYHRTCYRRYTNAKQLEAFKKNKEGHFESQYDAAFEALRSELEPKLFHNHEVVRMSDIRKRYVELLGEQGIQNPFYRAEKLKVRMQRAFQGRISFWHPRYCSEAEIIYCDEVPKGQIVECSIANINNLEKEIPVTCSPQDENNVYHAAKTVRAALLNQEASMAWPPHSSDIKTENISVPNVAYNLLAWILSDEDRPVEDNKVRVGVDEQCQRLVLSLAQYLLYNVSNGRHKTPKHVGLSLTVKNLTGSKEVVTLLNRLGHGMSYDQVLEMETRIAENQLEAQERVGVLLPKVVSPNVFTMFCWDNIDLLEETLSGRGTTHCTNGIVVQRQVYGCDPPPIVIRERKSRRRTFHAVPIQVFKLPFSILVTVL